MAGTSLVRNGAARFPASAVLTLTRRRTNRVAHYLCIEDRRTAPALRRILVRELSTLQVVGLTYLVGQSAIHERVGFTPKLLAPCPVFGQPSKSLLQGASRHIFSP
jgi:hypothetical protein